MFAISHFDFIKHMMSKPILYSGIGKWAMDLTLFLKTKQKKTHSLKNGPTTQGCGGVHVALFQLLFLTKSSKASAHEFVWIASLLVPSLHRSISWYQFNNYKLK